jgi:hypothetical protein
MEEVQKVFFGVKNAWYEKLLDEGAMTKYECFERANKEAEKVLPRLELNEQGWYAMSKQAIEHANVIFDAASTKMVDIGRDISEVCVGTTMATTVASTQKLLELQIEMVEAVKVYKQVKKHRQEVLNKAYDDWLECKLKVLSSKDTTARQKSNAIKEVAAGPQDYKPVTQHTFDFNHEDGTPCKTKQERAAVLERFLRKREAPDTDIDYTYLHNNADQMEIIKGLGVDPTLVELEQAIHRQKIGKTVLGIPVEILKALLYDPNKQMLHDLLDIITKHLHGEEGSPHVIADFGIKRLVGIPKGNKSTKDVKNIRWLTIMNSVEKIIESIMEKRLAEYIAERVPMWQGGGCRKREAAEIAFTLNRYLSMRKQHGMDTYCLFLDAVMAYDMIDRKVLYICLRKFGFDDDAIRWVESFHKGSVKEVTLAGEKISVPSTKGVPQGSPISPALYVIWHFIVATTYDKMFKPPKMMVTSNHDGDLSGVRHLKSTAVDGPNSVTFDVARLAYVDDTVLLFETREQLEYHTVKWIEHNIKCSGRPHTGTVEKKSKTKFMYMGHTARKKKETFERTGNNADVKVNEQEHIPATEFMQHLGTWYDCWLTFDRQLSVLLGRLSAKFNLLKNKLFMNKGVPVWLRKKYYETYFVPVLVFNCQSMPMNSHEYMALQSFHYRCVRTIANVSWQQQREEHLKREDIFKRADMGNITALLGQDDHYDVYAVEQEEGQPGKHFDVGVHRER